jgi:hypothetical protein
MTLCQSAISRRYNRQNRHKLWARLETTGRVLSPFSVGPSQRAAILSPFSGRRTWLRVEECLLHHATRWANL